MGFQDGARLFKGAWNADAPRHFFPLTFPSILNTLGLSGSVAGSVLISPYCAPILSYCVSGAFATMSVDNFLPALPDVAASPRVAMLCGNFKSRRAQLPKRKDGKKISGELGVTLPVTRVGLEKGPFGTFSHGGGFGMLGTIRLTAHCVSEGQMYQNRPHRP